MGARDTFELSHPVDDADIAFVMRLNRNSIFCTGLKAGSTQRSGLNGLVDPIINLCTVNYILSGIQMGMVPGTNDLWSELLYNLDSMHFPKVPARDYSPGAQPITLTDIIHIVRNCIRPFGIVRGSEKQGGQNESTMSPATWPVCFVVSITLDGKESNVLNVWHNKNLSAGGVR